MHEHSFIEAILREVEDKDKVERIILEVGDLVGIDGEHLRAHIEEMYDWDVEVVFRAGFVKCECGFEGEPRILERMHDMVIIECPVCHSFPEVLGGKDVKILKVVYR